MANGFDTSSNTEQMAAMIATEGFSFVGRYLCQSDWKRVTSTEAAALKAAGLDIVLIYEDAPTSDTYFQNGQGSTDAFHAISQATALGAVNGTAIYFTVDYDASPVAIAGPITEYFTEIATVLADTTANPHGYVVGVYGSGQTCQTIRNSSLAKYTWLAQSTDWSHGNSQAQWHIMQGQTSATCSLSVDLNTTMSPDFGAMKWSA